MLKELVPVTARGEATRRKLLAAAEVEIGEKGFHAASVSSITLRADVGQGIFYLYFRSKEEIFITLVRDIGNSLRENLMQAAAQSVETDDADRYCLQAFFRFASQHPGLYRIVQEAQFVDEPTYRDYYERLAQCYAQTIAAAEKRGELRSGNTEARAWAVMGIAHFVGLRWCLWQHAEPGQAVVDEVIGLIKSGIGSNAVAA